MPTNLPYSGARIPVNAESPAGPTAFSQFGTDIDQLLALKAASVADRDAKYSGVSVGTLVTCGALGVVWQKATATTWVVIGQNAVTVTTGIVSAVTGWAVAAQTAKPVTGGMFLHLRITNNTGADVVGASTTATNPGQITGTAIGTMSAGFIPAFGWRIFASGPVATAHGYINSSGGSIVLTDVYPSGKIRNGDTVEISTTIPV